MRLDPFYPSLTSFWLGVAHYALGEYSRALPPLRECASRAPNMRSAHAFLAATYAQVGHLVEARTEVAEALRIQPDYTIERAQEPFTIFNPKDTEHLCQGLRKAGLPER